MSRSRSASNETCIERKNSNTFSEKNADENCKEEHADESFLASFSQGTYLTSPFKMNKVLLIKYN